MIDTTKLFTVGIVAGLITAGFIALSACIRMFMAGKKVSGFGMLFIAIGILIDAFTTYSQLSGLTHFLPQLANQVFLLLKSVCFVAGSVMLLVAE